jgi:hypothetical protein
VTPATPTLAVLRRARVAVSAAFLVNGALIATIAPRLPEIRDALGLSNTELGFAVAFGPAGGLLAGAVAAALVNRVGSARLTAATGIASGLALALLGLAPTLPALALAFLALGALDATMDVAMNANGLRVQTAYRRSILHALHAFWSAGTLVGGVVAAVAAALRVPVAVHLAAAGAVLALVMLIALRAMLPRGPRPELAADGPTGRPAGRALAHARSLRLALVAVGGVAVMALLAAFIEDAPATWNAVFLLDAVGTPAALAGIGYVTWTAAMVTGRLLGDGLVRRFGTVTVVRAGAVASVGAFLLVVAAGALPAVGLPVALAGYAVLGLASAPFFPAMFDAAGRHPGVTAGEGVAIVSWISRAGFLLAPATVGVVADAAGLPVAMAIPLVAALGIAVVARTLAPRTPATVG